MRMLFICGRNQSRSPTAEKIFSGKPGFEVESAGVSPDADVPLTGELIEWAEILFVMEAIHRTKMKQKFPRELRGKRVICLGIADDYEYMDEGLIRLLRERVPSSVAGLEG